MLSYRHLPMRKGRFSLSCVVWWHLPLKKSCHRSRECGSESEYYTELEQRTSIVQSSVTLLRASALLAAYQRCWGAASALSWSCEMVHHGTDVGQWHCERNGELLVLSSHEGSRPHLCGECSRVPRKTMKSGGETRSQVSQTCEVWGRTAPVATSGYQVQLSYFWIAAPSCKLCWFFFPVFFKLSSSYIIFQTVSCIHFFTFFLFISSFLSL